MSITDQAPARAPIGVFDSGLGGFTVLRELMRELPHERFIFLGDSARCPYGPRQPHEVRSFALEISAHLVSLGCKMLVIACNTATAAGLSAVQQAFSVPVVGVVEPGARAAVHMTRTRRVAVIATEGTIAQGAYERAIAHLDAGITVLSRATPEFVSIAEARFAGDGAGASAEELHSVQRHLAPLKEQNVDTLVLGCTHYPLIADLIAEQMGEGVALVSSAEETAREVRALLQRRGDMADDGAPLALEMIVTGDDAQKFALTAKGLLGVEAPVARVQLDCLKEDVA